MKSNHFVNKFAAFLSLLIAAVFLLFFVAPEVFSMSMLQAQGASTLVKFKSTPISRQSAPENVITRILFTGDINLGRCVAKATIIAKDYTYPFKLVADKLNAADITVGSLDGSISDASPPMPCPNSMNLIGPERMAEGLKFAGFDVITIATNHVKDCGEKGFGCKDHSFQDTLKAIANEGIQPVGGGNNLDLALKPVILEHNGIRFAFIGIDQIEPLVWATESQPGAAPLSPDAVDNIITEIKETRKIADVVIVLPQWGTEYAPAPDAIQREWAQQFHDAGAALVIGNHPHIIQPVEEFQNGVTFYALGNFVFDQEQRFRRESIVVEAVFNDSKLDSWKAIPVLINFYTYQPSWVEGREGIEILARTIFP